MKKVAKNSIGPKAKSVGVKADFKPKRGKTAPPISTRKVAGGKVMS